VKEHNKSFKTEDKEDRSGSSSKGISEKFEEDDSGSSEDGAIS